MPKRDNPPHSPDDRFITAFSESQAALRGYCASSIGNLDDSRDVFQKVCLVLWKKSGVWDPETSFFKWAFAVARFEILAYVRDRSRERLVFDDDIVLAMAGTSERLAEAQSERYDALEICLSKLKPEHRETLAEHYVKGYTLKEIAESQNRGHSAVKVMVMRLRQTLGKCIESQIVGTA